MLPWTPEAEFPPLPPKVAFLIELAWDTAAPIHTGVMAYWAWPDPARRRVFLWVSTKDMEEYFDEYPFIAADLTDDVKASYMHALMRAWRLEQREYGTRPPYQVTQEGLLSASDIKEIVAQAWAPEPEEDE
jgi:hypothetical protein